MIRAISLLLAGALAIGAAACGAGGRPTKSDYEAKMGRLGRDFSAQLLDFKPTNFKAAQAYFQAMASRLKTVAGEAETIDPPRGVRDIHARIVDGLRKEAAAVQAFADRLRGASVRQVELILRRYDWSDFRAALQQLNDAGAELAARGYRISSSAGK